MTILQDLSAIAAAAERMNDANAECSLCRPNDTCFWHRSFAQKSAKDETADRIKAQAWKRASANGVDPYSAAEVAEQYLHEGKSHEEALTLACGAYRRMA
jgi:hypothetical protein